MKDLFCLMTTVFSKIDKLAATPLPWRTDATSRLFFKYRTSKDSY